MNAFEPITLVIEPSGAERDYWRDLWRYRELFWVLAWRDITVRYKQTIIGFAWAIVQPLLTVVAFTVVFGQLAKMPADGGAPYALLVCSGLLPWQLVSTSLTCAAGSLIANANLINKVYFPRLIVPIAAIVVCFADFLVAFIILVSLYFWYGFVPGWQIVTLPFFIAIAFLSSLGPGLWISALNVRYRDFRYVIPFMVQFGLYVSPVGYSISAVPDEWRSLFYLNPIAGVIDGFRWAMLGGKSELDLIGFLTSLTVTSFFLWFGVGQFRKMEKSFADRI